MPQKPSSTSRKKQAGRAIQRIPPKLKRPLDLFFANLKRDKIEAYVQDWAKLTPSSPRESLHRWLFAYCTIHTPWERSCEQFNMIKDLHGITPTSHLKDLLSQSTGGMYNIKAKGIHHFQLNWVNKPDFFKPTYGWQAWRNDLVQTLPNIGYAKTSFAIEMNYPLQAQCLCLDRHMLKAFGWNIERTANQRQYEHYESYWLNKSKQLNIPPVISRNIFWDELQNQPNSLYWAHVLQ